MQKTKNLLPICVIAFIFIAIFGAIIWRNMYGRRERVRVYLRNAVPNLSKSDIWDIDQYTENRTTKWRVRKFKTSGVIKGNQTLFSLKGMYEPRQGDPLSLIIYNFETLKEMASGVPFEVNFDSESNTAQYTKVSFPIPQFYTAQDLKELSTKGAVVVDGEIMEESLPLFKDIRQFAVQLDLQLKEFDKDFAQFERFFSDDFSSLSRNEKKNQITQIKNDIYGRLALLTVITRFCRTDAALKDYAAKSLQHSVKYHSMLSRVSELEKLIPSRENIRIGVDSPNSSPANSASKNPTQPGSNQATHEQRPVSETKELIPVRPVVEPEKLLPAMMPKADARIENWAKLHRPDLYDRYTSCLAECEKKQSFELKASAILKYNEVYKYLISEKQSYDANPVKNKDLEPEIIEFAETECPEYHRKYLKAKRSIRNRRILYNKARSDGVPQGRLDQLQAEINGAIVSFNDARQHILNLYQKKK